MQSEIVSIARRFFIILLVYCTVAVWLSDEISAVMYFGVPSPGPSSSAMLKLVCIESGAPGGNSLGNPVLGVVPMVGGGNSPLSFGPG